MNGKQENRVGCGEHTITLWKNTVKGKLIIAWITKEWLWIFGELFYKFAHLGLGSWPRPWVQACTEKQINQPVYNNNNDRTKFNRQNRCYVNYGLVTLYWSCNNSPNIVYSGWLHLCLCISLPCDHTCITSLKNKVLYTAASLIQFISFQNLASASSARANYGN